MNEIIEQMVGHYGDLRAFARGLPVDAAEVAAALAQAEPDTAEFVCLQILSELNPDDDNSQHE